nr:hypothetical protein [Burkholderia pyrrocinia]
MARASVRVLWHLPEVVRRRCVRAPVALSVARQCARTAERDRGGAAAVGQPGDQGRQAACRDRRGGADRCVRRAARRRARAGCGRLVEEGRGGIDSPRACASCRQPDEGGESARHREEHAL